jgi:hypothetical protein
VVEHGEVRYGLVGYSEAGQARFVGVWCGAARSGSSRQVGWGEVSSGEVG